MHDENDVWYQPLKIEPISPCNKNCIVSSEVGYCLGCFLSLKEMVQWEEEDAAGREIILEKVKERKKRVMNETKTSV
jgi:predicted Fe-S protein YdhL (DUF1289 family)